MEIGDHTSTALRALEQKVFDELAGCVSSQLENDVSRAEIAELCCSGRLVAHHFQADGATVYILGEKQILYVGKVTFSMDGDTITASQQIQRLI